MAQPATRIVLDGTARSVYPPSVLLGPADADHYRVKVGRFGDRHYTDPLPGCDIAPATDWVGPSISTVKKAAGQDWTFVGLKRVAHADDLSAVAQLEPTQRYERLKQMNSGGLKVAAGRGTIVHLWFEDILAGREPREITDALLSALKLPTAARDEAEQYRHAVVNFGLIYQPELYAAELVCIHRTLNGVGYGGTGDAIVRIDGDLWYVDWKSRGVDSDHGAYAEESAQIAANAAADYFIGTGPDGQPARLRLPDLAGGLVVSVKPDGCRIYPTDLTKGFEHWTSLHAWWVARRSETKSIGRPWAPRVAPDAAATLTGVGAPTPAPSHGGAGVTQTQETQGDALCDTDAPQPPPAAGSSSRPTPPTATPTTNSSTSSETTNSTGSPSNSSTPATTAADSDRTTSSPTFNASSATTRPSASPTAQMVAAQADAEEPLPDPCEPVERQALRDRKAELQQRADANNWADTFTGIWRTSGITANSPNADISHALDLIERAGGKRENAALSKADLKTLSAHIRDSEHHDTVLRWLTEGHRGGNSWDPRTHPDVRRYEITRAALALATASDGRDDLAHLIINLGVPLIDAVDRFVSLPIGCVLGLLSIDEAKAVHAEADAFIDGRYLLLYDADGHPYLQAAA
jgi:hypothetical protein